MTAQRLTYITRNYKSTGYGGAKARIDVEDILTGIGAVNIGRPRTFHSNKIVDYLLNLVGIVHFMFAVRRGDVVVLQYPVKKYYCFICRWVRLRHAQTVTLIHDLGSFRRKRISVSREIKKLSLTDAIIAANANTVAWLKEQGCRVPLTEQVAWDYLSDAVPVICEYPAVSCAFIGTVKPSVNGFLYHLPASMEVHLYGGDMPAGCRREGLHVYGHKPCDELIEKSAGRYGLIWYGTSLTEHIGYIGEYIRYCNPHKLALYMRCGKPVIIWRESGEAGFVEREGIGLTVDTLENLEQILSAVTPGQYAAMCENVRRVGRLMAHGHYLRTALEKAVASLPEDL